MPDVSGNMSTDQWTRAFELAKESAGGDSDLLSELVFRLTRVKPTEGRPLDNYIRAVLKGHKLNYLRQRTKRASRYPAMLSEVGEDTQVEDSLHALYMDDPPEYDADTAVNAAVPAPLYTEDMDKEVAAILRVLTEKEKEFLLVYRTGVSVQDASAILGVGVARAYQLRASIAEAVKLYQSLDYEMFLETFNKRRGQQ